jgi:hypothetical protein
MFGEEYKLCGQRRIKITPNVRIVILDVIFQRKPGYGFLVGYFTTSVARLQSVGRWDER